VQELAPQYLEEDRRRGLPGGRCWFAIPNFVDCEKFKPQDALRVRRRLDIPEGKFIILEVAAVKSSHKRIDYLIGEAALLRKKYPEVFVIVAGAQTIETSRLITMGKEQFGDNIRFLLNRPSDEMPDIYAAADIFAHSALFEMMPIALLESLSSGLPVIANKNPVFDWIIAGGGRTVDIQKSGSLAAAIEEYIKRPEIRAESSSAARRQALMNFEASRVTEQIVAMYENILKNER
jgi:1,2-diacylglycerol 3-alpha-glucosyltransferase